ncbi:preprotein translocase subunit SecE [Brevibacillus dissolubilis]|uniref:preprotein translocase subunit SecE n=1 Tax=Brevibacillus dissolubilis TaxID=1844116 RepID=UPI001116E7FF|nr:preprotein translocase subunit SecE [Brevibacillus dissolubilis]
MSFLSRVGSGFRRSGGFIGDVFSELKKVRWPNRKELTSYTLIVLVTITLLAVFLFGVDLGISSLIEWVLGK